VSKEKWQVCAGCQVKRGITACPCLGKKIPGPRAGESSTVMTMTDYHMRTLHDCGDVYNGDETWIRELLNSVVMSQTDREFIVARIVDELTFAELAVKFKYNNRQVAKRHWIKLLKMLKAELNG